MTKSETCLDLAEKVENRVFLSTSYERMQLDLEIVNALGEYDPPYQFHPEYGDTNIRAVYTSDHGPSRYATLEDVTDMDALMELMPKDFSLSLNVKGASILAHVYGYSSKGWISVTNEKTNLRVGEACCSAILRAKAELLKRSGE